MGEANFKTIEKRLLRGGVSPKHVKRTIRELNHHYADLVAKVKSDGASAAEASNLAGKRLGSDDQIVRKVLNRPELISWAHRWPWMIYGIGPVVGYFLLVVLIAGAIGVWLGIADERLSREAFFDMLTAGWVRFLFEHFTLLILHPLSTITAALICFIAAKREMPILWPVVGVVLVCVFGSGLDAHFEIPGTPDGPGSFGAGWGPSWTMLGQGMLSSGLILSGYLWWRARHANIVA